MARPSKTYSDIPFVVVALLLCAGLFMAGRYSVTALRSAPAPVVTVVEVPARVVQTPVAPVAAVVSEPPLAILPEVETVRTPAPQVVAPKPSSTVAVKAPSAPTPETIVLEETPENPYRVSNRTRRPSDNPGF